MFNFQTHISTRQTNNQCCQSENNVAGPTTVLQVQVLQDAYRTANNVAGPKQMLRVRKTCCRNCRADNIDYLFACLVETGF